MLGALIPVSDALRTTGGTDLIASALSHVSTNLPPIGALALLPHRSSPALGQAQGRRGNRLPLSIVVVIGGVPLIAFFWSI